MEYIFKIVYSNGENRLFDVHTFHRLEQLMSEWYDEDNGDELQEHVNEFGDLYGYTIYK